ncbi:MAG: 3-phosphoshikimate 1-carboxyvinyltransferase [Chloroflexota bacterium]
MSTHAVTNAPAATRPTEPAVVASARRLRGELRMPGDKSISHRALMLALIAEGTSTIEGAGDGADVRSTADIVRALGATVDRTADPDGSITYRVSSPGIEAMNPAPIVLDCGNSGTSLRLFAGILAGSTAQVVLDGDGSLRSRPMARIIDPLRAMGASVTARGDNGRPPLEVAGRGDLVGVDWTTGVPSAQVKSAILLAGLRAAGTTRVHEAVATRDHTERMLRARGVAVRTSADPAMDRRGEAGGGAAIEIDGGGRVRAIDDMVPGDLSAAAFWLVGASVHPDAELTLRGVGTNPTRRGIVDLLIRMGADIDERAHPAVSGSGDDVGSIGEPMADFAVRSAALRGIEVSPGDVAGAIDEIPILCLAATQASGRTTIRGAGELRHKESDRLAGIAAGLTLLGARIEVDGDDLIIDGPTALVGAATDSLDDHRLAMTFAIAGLLASGRTTIGQPDSASISYPRFFAELERIRT